MMLQRHEILTYRSYPLQTPTPHHTPVPLLSLCPSGQQQVKFLRLWGPYQMSDLRFKFRALSPLPLPFSLPRPP
jgi:hypothetical protein